ncbi:MAG: hypothetical protein J7M27_07905 [Candidatus Latescibacteria bacterium]|nr:hypothetical protein [Candidatus Latescibacterota bacterium]
MAIFEIVAIVGNGDGAGWEDTVKFAHERADDYCGLTVEGALMADGGDSTGTILFTSGAEE